MRQLSSTLSSRRGKHMGTWISSNSTNCKFSVSYLHHYYAQELLGEQCHSYYKEGVCVCVCVMGVFVYLTLRQRMSLLYWLYQSELSRQPSPHSILCERLQTNYSLGNSAQHFVWANLNLHWVRYVFKNSLNSLNGTTATRETCRTPSSRNHSDVAVDEIRLQRRNTSPLTGSEELELEWNPSCLLSSSEGGSFTRPRQIFHLHFWSLWYEASQTNRFGLDAGLQLIIFISNWAFLPSQVSDCISFGQKKWSKSSHIWEARISKCLAWIND